MNIDMLHFTPASAVAGGLMIGAAVALYILLNGRIAGISGMLGRLIEPKSMERAVPLAFLAGLIAAPWGWRLFASLPAVDIGASNLTLIAAGLLVGFGTRYGSGCTSGHGVCGISRGSARSFAATATFMSFGFLIVFLLRHL
ncbi:YeeE/YedE family protein [Trinickia dinghuensis]|uniref:YeeE/YedE family protein n=1 Tax=Trinickia dinghuensis TaxID=2291023 RepID=A0A3D8JRC2_9BURK|nr:YeeE/YedE family protein [Trinickia dinghuensis]RDU94971.1 YeeE/YedE family protein [Trinickia dinghuensis]